MPPDPAMTTPLRVLIVEDSEDDAELVLRELKRGGFEPDWIRVDTPEGVMAAFDARSWEIVLCDYSMPRLSAPEAFALVKRRDADIPFIIVSGTVGEETAVQAMQMGVQDYLIKGKLTRLAPAVRRELREGILRTERRRLQEQLLVSDRMVSLGTLAAGVAHEINNPLSALLANIDFATQDLARLLSDARAKEPPITPPAQPSGIAALLETRVVEVRQSLDYARESADRVRQIVRDLKILSRSDDERREAVDVLRVLESSIRIASNEIRHRAKLVRNFTEVPHVDGNEARLGQVFLNLVINAAQAIPEGNSDNNVITVTTTVDDRNRVVVEIRDTGSGIAADVLPHIFDPFYTTKPVGVGTGLGLAISHRIVRGYDGEISVESVVGRGTVFRVALPIARTAPKEVPKPGPSAFPAPRRGRFLVVEDEPMVAAALERLLAPEHDVACVSEARRALEIVSSGERFDIIFCDLMMPFMTGAELHTRIEEVAPDQAAKMVFMTGGAFTTATRAFLERVPNARLDKPFDVTNLRFVIQSMLR